MGKIQEVDSSGLCPLKSGCLCIRPCVSNLDVLA